MYLRETDVYADHGAVDLQNREFSRDFYYQTCHITCYFTNLIYRKIKNDNFWKICVCLCPKQPVNGKYEKKYSAGLFYEDKYRLLGDVLETNAFFDFYRYNRFKNDADKSRMTTDVFEDELIEAFNRYGVGREGTIAAKNAFEEIRKNNYVYKGLCKQSLLSPDKTYKVFFEFVWKFGGIDLYVRIRKPRAKHDLSVSYLTTIRSDWISVKSYIESIVWLSENEFVAKMEDLSRHEKYFNITECRAQNVKLKITIKGTRIQYFL